MRGADITQKALFTTVHLEEFVPKSHPLRKIRQEFNLALLRIDWLLDCAYAPNGKESIPPERLLRALLLQVLFSVRSERQLMEQMHYNLLFCWFVGLSIDDKVWNHSTFSKNRDRLLAHDIIPTLFEEVVQITRQKQLLSKEHFSADSTLVQAWASHKSFRRKQGSGSNSGWDFHREKRSNETHESRTDPKARLYNKSKGAEAKLAYLDHTTMENRNGLIVQAAVTQANGCAEREADADGAAGLASQNRWRKQGLRHSGIRSRLSWCQCNSACGPKYQAPRWLRY